MIEVDLEVAPVQPEVTLKTEITPETEVTLETEDAMIISEKDYNNLENKPKLNGEEIIGEMSEIDPTVPDWAKQDTKPSYTAQEIGAISDADVITLEELSNMFLNI